MRPALDEIAAQFERATGYRIIAKFVSGPVVNQEIDAGAPFDVVLSNSFVIDDLIRAGKVDAGTRADIAYAGFGMLVRSGAAKRRERALKECRLLGGAA